MSRPHTISMDTTCATTITKPESSTRPSLSTGDGDHDRFAHYVRKADTVRAYVEGTPIRALCGKIWVPSRDPSRYPLCLTCVEIREGLPSRNKS